MALAGTKFREWHRRLEAAQRKIREVHREICERESDNEILQMSAWNASGSLSETIGMLKAIIDNLRDRRGGRPDLVL